jgi:molecular chaperone HscC
MTFTSAPIVGIDLGTTMSAIAVCLAGEVRFIPNALGETLTPSVVAFDGRAGGMVVGRTAKDILAVQPRMGAAAFKRDMGSNRELALGERRHTSVELSAYVLDALRSDAERSLGQTVDRCVVTVPAYFSEAQRHATKQAAEMVGFKVERILNEPTAAAIAYGLHESDGDKQFVVLDLGGGTFDVCVMELFEGLLEVKGVAGVSQLGGEDFTLALKQLALSKAGVRPERLGVDLDVRLLRRAELLKRRLSRWPASDIDVPTGDGEQQVTVSISAAEAELAYKPLLDRMIAPCRSALRGAGVLVEQLDDVILVGGATRMPCVAKLAEELFGRPARVHEDPDHLVARGAALQAALSAKDASVSEIVVTDVASHSLGIAVAREVRDELQHGFFSPIIERNTVIPTSRAETFSTLHADQSQIRVQVFEGESRRTSGNRLLGELEVTDIPKGPPREVVRVRFTFDLSGLLEVEATLLETGKRAARIFQRGKQDLSEAELAEARAELSRLKADPKERPRHRDLLARAGALWMDLRGAARERLAHGIDEFEAALDARNPREIERCYERLLSLCAQADEGERW